MIHSNGYHGVYLYTYYAQAGFDNILADNSVKFNRRYALYLDTYYRITYVQRNDISQNVYTSGYHVLYVNTYANVTIEDNIINDNSNPSAANVNLNFYLTSNSNSAIVRNNTFNRNSGSQTVILNLSGKKLQYDNIPIRER